MDSEDIKRTKREAVMKDVVSHIVARLKKIPSSNAPEDLGLDGSAFEEIAYQLQYGESVFWDLYEDITYTECEKAYQNLTEKQRDILLDDYVSYDEGDDQDEIESKKGDAVNQVVKEIECAVFGYADDYELEMEGEE
jgi:hypothetical protein